MKTNYIHTVAFTFLLAGSANSQIQNSGFESWTNQDPDNWMTVNDVSAGLVNVSESTDKHSGTLAAHCQVVDFFGTPISPLLQSGANGEGFPINQAFGSVNFFYKYSPVGGDQFMIHILFKKAGDVIALGALNLSNSVNVYTQLSLPMTYFDMQIPDTVVIQLSIGGPTGSDYHIGSEAFIDDFSLNGIASLNSITTENASETNFPNPCSEFVFIRIKDQKNGTIEILDLLGNVIKKVAFSEQNSSNPYYQLDISDLPSGCYLYSLNEQQINSQSKIIIKH